MNAEKPTGANSAKLLRHFFAKQLAKKFAKLRAKSHSNGKFQGGLETGGSGVLVKVDRGKQRGREIAGMKQRRATDCCQPVVGIIGQP